MRKLNFPKNGVFSSVRPAALAGEEVEKRNFESQSCFTKILRNSANPVIAFFLGNWECCSILKKCDHLHPNFDMVRCKKS